MSLIECAAPPKEKIHQFFDAIAFRYDFLNSLLSFRLDQEWRQRARDLILEGWEQSILDLGVGTGKFLRIFLDAQSWKRAVGLDFSERMLRRAMQKGPGPFLGKPSQERGLAPFGVVSADFHSLPFTRESFDLVVSAFTLRSVKDMPHFLSEVYNLLKSRGKAGFLCLTRPTSRFWQIATYPYLKFYLPIAGGLLTGDFRAYRFLSESILNFQEPEKTAAMMREAGFSDVQIRRFTFGLATLISGRK